MHGQEEVMQRAEGAWEEERVVFKGSWGMEAGGGMMQ